MRYVLVSSSRSPSSKFIKNEKLKEGQEGG
jgi:hypothetical protein